MKLTGSPHPNMRARQLGVSIPGLLFIASLCASQAQAQAPTLDPSTCTMGTPFGDYLVDKSNVAMSERHHFTPAVEALIRGQSTVLPGKDINFMLVNYPNHHRALIAMMKLGEKQKTQQPEGATFTVECYFDRAIRFRPKDVVARLLYANYLARNKRKADAAAQLDYAAKMAPDNGLTQHNIGLVYLELGDTERALQQAHRAHAMGLDRSELSSRLKAAGKWTDPVAASPGAASPTEAAATASQPVPAAQTQ